MPSADLLPAQNYKPTLSGKPMPVVGLGTWQSKPGELGVAVKVAIDAGYRHIDTARRYFNEGEIGDALEDRIKAGKVTRDEMFLTTKLSGGAALPHRVRQQTEISLKLLKTDYIDLLLIHFPIAFSDVKLDDTPPKFYPFEEDGAPMVMDTDYLDTYKEMEKLVDAGLVKAIGLSNFNLDQVRRIWEAARIKPSNLQIECHAWLPQYELSEYCNEKRIVLSAYGPIGSPGRIYRGNSELLDDPVVVKLAKKLQRTPAQILLRCLIQRGIPVIPKSVNKSRIESNIQVFDFILSLDDMAELKSINKEERLFNFIFITHERTLNHPHWPWLSK